MDPINKEFLIESVMKQQGGSVVFVGLKHGRSYIQYKYGHVTITIDAILHSFSNYLEKSELGENLALVDELGQRIFSNLPQEVTIPGFKEIRVTPTHDWMQSIEELIVPYKMERRATSPKKSCIIL